MLNPKIYKRDKSVVYHDNNYTYTAYRNCLGYISYMVFNKKTGTYAECTNKMLAILHKLEEFVPA